MESAIACVFLDVGGTLWSSQWPTAVIKEVRIAQLHVALPKLTLTQIKELDHVFQTRYAAYRARMQAAHLLVQDTDAVIREVTQVFGLPSDDQTIRSLRTALSVNPIGHITPFIGARELVQQIKAWGVGCVIVSNARVSDSAAYYRAFASLGISHAIDAVISSVDIGFHKPHRAMFDAALAAGHCLSHQCVMIGNSETKDVQPALARGMRTIRVAIEEPKPPSSDAHAVVDSLPAATAVLQAWIALDVHDSQPS